MQIRNIPRTHVSRWDEIERFELARYDPWPRIGAAAKASAAQPVA
jgi:hypothetical protein